MAYVQGVLYSWMCSMYRALLALLLVGCSEVTGPVIELPGSYELVSVNGDPLPQTVALVAPGVKKVIGGTITLRSDGTFTDMAITRFSYDTINSDHELSGTYTRQDSTVTFSTGATTIDGRAATYRMIFHANGSLTRFFPRQQFEPFVDVTYRYQKH